MLGEEQKKKSQSGYKPGSVPKGLLAHTGVCHLSARIVANPLYRSTLQRTAAALRRTGGLGKGNPQSLVYMNFQLPMCTARVSPHGWWALTPPSHPYSP